MKVSDMDEEDCLPRALPSTDEVYAYLKALKDFPVLRTPEACLEVFHRYVQAESDIERRQARDELLYGLRMLNFKIALSFRGKGLELTDLMNEGVKGLMKAISKHDPTKGPFPGYARIWIRHYMRRALEDTKLGRIGRVPAHYNQLLSLLRRAQRDLYQLTSEWPTESQLHAQIQTYNTNIGKSTKVEGVKEALQFLRDFEEAFSLDEEVTNEPPPEWGPRTVKEEEWLGTPAVAETAVEDKEILNRLDKAMAILPERMRVIIQDRFGLSGEEKTLEEIGERFEIGPERIRQLEVEALKKLRRFYKQST